MFDFNKLTTFDVNHKQMFDNKRKLKQYARITEICQDMINSGEEELVNFALRALLEMTDKIEELEITILKSGD